MDLLSEPFSSLLGAVLRTSQYRWSSIPVREKRNKREGKGTGGELELTERIDIYVHEYFLSFSRNYQTTRLLQHRIIESLSSSQIFLLLFLLLRGF